MGFVTKMGCGVLVCAVLVLTPLPITVVSGSMGWEDVLI